MQYNPKRYFIKARPEGRFYENLICIALIIESELDTMKKSRTVLIFSKNLNQTLGYMACAKKSAPKMLKIIKNDQNQDFELRFQGNQSTHKQALAVYRKNSKRSYYEKIFHEEISKTR